jgi:hypothetical protein
MNPEWTPPPAPPLASPQNPRRNRGKLAAIGLLGAGVAAGAVIGATTLSNAATTPSTSAGTSSSGTSSSASSSGTSSSGTSSSASSEAAEPHHGGGLDLSGTVTAVGSSSVTIKTASGTVQYAVLSSSDIDKNGESSLGKLAVGDAVTYSADTVNGASTIDKLHAGTESLNQPQGAANGGASG